jgi:hypothetical protein
MRIRRSLIAGVVRIDWDADPPMVSLEIRLLDGSTPIRQRIPLRDLAPRTPPVPAGGEQRGEESRIEISTLFRLSVLEISSLLP